MFSLQSLEKMHDKYTMDENNFIGQGSFAKVIKGHENHSKQPVAIKIIRKQRMDEQQQILLEREIYLMRNINHPNIVEFHDCYADKKNIYMVLQYLSGGQLYDEIMQKQVYSEIQARNIIFPIIDATRYLHQCGIVHRDLKPQNCVFSSKKNDRVIKLIDFGVSQMIANDTHLMSTNVGTPLYMAPEILCGRKYDEKVDWWAIGIILYVMLCGYAPFGSENEFDLRNQIINGGVKFDEQDWSEVSKEGRNLVSQMLSTDPSKRINAEGIISHPWITIQKTKQLTRAQKNLKKFVSKLKVVQNALRAVKFMKQGIQ